MLILLLITAAIATYNKLNLKPAFRCWWLLPIVFVEAGYLTFQISAFFGYYGFLPYAELLKSISLYILFLPILRYGLYLPAMIGSGMILLGTLLNKLVIAANNGYMPVFPTISKWTGYYEESPLGNYDLVHYTGNGEAKLKFLSDYIDIGYCVLSPGDLLIHSFTIIVLYYTIKQLNQQS